MEVRLEDGEGRERLEDVVLETVCEASDLPGEGWLQLSLFFSWKKLNLINNFFTNNKLYVY